MEVFEETGYYLGLCVANLINLLNPEMVVIGGGIAQAGELILEPIRRTAYACAIRSLSRTCRIVPPSWATTRASWAASHWSCKELRNFKTRTTFPPNHPFSP